MRCSSRTLFRSLVLPCALLASGCEPDAVVRTELTTNAADIRAACSPDDVFPLEVGEFRLQIFQGQFEDLVVSDFLLTTEIENLSPPLASGHSPSAPITIEVDHPSSVPTPPPLPQLPLPPSSTLVKVIATGCDFTRARVTFLFEVEGRRVSDNALEVRGIQGSFVVTNTTPPDVIKSPPQRLVEAVVGAEITDFEQFSFQAPVGVPVLNPNDGVDPQIPTDPYTETFEYGYVVTELDEQQITDAFTASQPRFPVGEGPFGFSFRNVRPAPLLPGRYLLAWQSVQEPVPLEGDQDLRYGLAIDRDGDPTNNVMGMEPTTFDQFDGTDTQITVFYSNNRWTFTLLDVQNPRPAVIPSGTLMVFSEQVLLLILPLADLGDPMEFPGRFVTFAHRGDFGLAQPWSADATPPVPEGLIDFDLATDF